MKLCTITIEGLAPDMADEIEEHLKYLGIEWERNDRVGVEKEVTDKSLFIEQWEKEVEEKATKIAYFFGAVRGLQKSIELDDNNMPSDDDLRKIAMFLAKAIHPNPLNRPMGRRLDDKISSSF